MATSKKEEWQLVRRKKNQTQQILKKEIKGRMDIAGDRHASKEGIVSFYFSEFPDSHGAKEMMRAFAVYGKIVEVVIPPRRNKWGKRFGFARFANVQDPRLFAVKLDNIIFGANKIHANLPRFERKKQEAKMRKPEHGANPQKQHQMEWRKVQDRGAGVEVKRSKQWMADERFSAKRWRRGARGEITNEKWKGNEGWKGRQNRSYPEQKIVYYRKKNLCDVKYNCNTPFLPHITRHLSE